LCIGKNRFKALRSSFPTQKDLVKLIELLRNNWRNAVSPGSIVTFDETIFEFQPGSKSKEDAEKNRDPIPVVFIPSKPHPNGLLCYFFGVRMQNTLLPYMFDLEPHISFPQVSPQGALLNCINRWIYHYKSHIVADSAFGSLNVTNVIKDWGFFNILD
jgi:hypothetical protein